MVCKGILKSRNLMLLCKSLSLALTLSSLIVRIRGCPVKNACRIMSAVRPISYK